MKVIGGVPRGSWASAGQAIAVVGYWRPYAARGASVGVKGGSRHCLFVALRGGCRCLPLGLSVEGDSAS